MEKIAIMTGEVRIAGNWKVANDITAMERPIISNGTVWVTRFRSNLTSLVT